MEKKEKVIGSIVILIGCTIFLVVGYILSKPKAYNNDIFVSSNSSTSEAKDAVIVDNSQDSSIGSSKDEFKSIVVEIKGEVKNPDVYTVDFGSRVNDLVKKAGGFTEEADDLGINLSMKLVDEDCIVVYKKGQGDNAGIPGANTIRNINEESTVSTLNNEKININTATKEELMTLPGIGEVTAERIIEYRESNGEFSSIEDLTKVDRIGEKTLSKFKDKIQVR